MRAALPAAALSAASVRAALKAARAYDRATFLSRTSALALHTPKESSGDLLWVEAERAHLCGQFVTASQLFKRWIDEQGDAGSPWQRFLAYARRAYHAMRFDDRRTLVEALDAATLIQQAHSNALDDYLPELDMLAAHELEFHGSLELARARFIFGYDAAVARGRHAKAAAIASEVGRILATLRRIPDAYEWQHRALEHLRNQPNDLHRRTIEARIAKLDRGTRRLVGARAALERLYEGCVADVDSAARPWCATPEPLIGILTSLHEIDLLDGHLERAGKHLRAALATARRMGSRQDLIHVSRDLARWTLTLASPEGPSAGRGDRGRNRTREEQAAGYFREAMRFAILAPSRRRLTLLGLADDLRFFPELAHGQSETTRKDTLLKIEAEAEGLRALLRPSLHGMRRVTEARTVQEHALITVLRKAVNVPVRLRAGTVSLQNGEVRRAGHHPVNLSEPALKMVVCMLRTEWSTAPELARAAGIRSPYGKISELARTLGETNFEKQRPAGGRDKCFRLHLAPAEEDTLDMEPE